MGAGSASPVVSTMSRRYGGISPRARRLLSVDDRVLEIALDGAAEAAALQQHGVLVHRLDQKVIEADGAELVDNHCGVS